MAVHEWTNGATERQHRDHQAWCEAVGATRIHLSAPPQTLVNMCKAAAGAPVLLTLRDQVDRPVVVVSFEQFEAMRKAASAHLVDLVGQEVAMVLALPRRDQRVAGLLVAVDGQTLKVRSVDGRTPGREILVMLQHVWSIQRVNQATGG